VPSRVDGPFQTATGVRYKAVVTIGSGRGAPRLTRTVRTPQAASEALRHLERVATGDHTVAEVMAGYLAHLASRGETASVTLERYRQVCVTLAKTPIWERPTARLRPQEIEVAIMSTSGRQTTQALRWRVLRAGLRWGARCWKTSDPTPNVTPPRAGRVERPVLDGAELGALIASIPPNSALLDPFVLLAVVTGKRRNEVLALRVRDVDGDKVSIGESLEWIAGQDWRVKETKTGSVGEVQLPAFAAERVREIMRARFNRPDAFLCSQDGGLTPLDPKAVSLAFRAHADSRGLERLRVEDLRQFATVRITSGVPLGAVEDALRHATPRTTRRASIRRAWRACRSVVARVPISKGK
jgi:integrase